VRIKTENICFSLGWIRLQESTKVPIQFFKIGFKVCLKFKKRVVSAISSAYWNCFENVDETSDKYKLSQDTYLRKSFVKSLPPATLNTNKNLNETIR
jgi:hypothetical protein